MTMRVLFLTHSPGTPSTRLRIDALVPFYEREGIECRVERISRGFLGRIGQLLRAADYDVVVLQKRLMSPIAFRVLRGRAKKMIYDFDDAIWLKREGSEARPSPVRERRFANAVAKSDWVVAGNGPLAERARRHVDPSRVKVVPLSVDIERWRTKKFDGRPREITLGWMGSPSNHVFLKPLDDVLRRVCKAFPQVRFKVISDKPYAIDGVTCLHKAWSDTDEVDDVLTFDIALAPYPEDEWTRGKSPTKVLMGMAAGLPVVASDVTCVRDVVTDGTDGLLADGPEAFHAQIMRLIDSWDFAARLGAEGRRTIERRFDIRPVVAQWLELLRS
jgi:glycosyltransferase involved in cell wall biosynthesis